MSNWFYYNESGDKIAVTGGQLKGLAKLGRITPETIVETEDGKKAKAGKVKGLTFITPEAIPSETASPESAPPVESEIYGIAAPPPKPSPFTAPMSAITKPAANPFTAAMPESTNSVTAAPSPFTQTMPPVYSDASTAHSQVTSSQDYDYRSIASLQRLSTWSILSFLLAGGIVRILQGSLGAGTLFGGLLAVGASIFSIFAMARLARSLQYGTGAIVGFALCIVPGGMVLLPAFIPLITVYSRAIKVLKQAGYRIGLIGADMQQFGENPRIPDGVQTGLLCVGIVCFLGLAIIAEPRSGEDESGRPAVVAQQQSKATEQDRAAIRKKIDFLLKEGDDTEVIFAETGQSRTVTLRNLPLTDKEKEAVVEYVILAERTFQDTYSEDKLSFLLLQVGKLKLTTRNATNVEKNHAHRLGEYAFARYDNIDIYVVCLADYVGTRGPYIRGSTYVSDPRLRKLGITRSYERELPRVETLFIESLFPECNRLSGNAHDKAEKVRLDTMAKDRAEPAQQPDLPVVAKQQNNAVPNQLPKATEQDRAAIRKKIDFLLKEGLSGDGSGIWDLTMKDKLTLTDKEKEAVVEYVILAENTFKRQYAEYDLYKLLRGILLCKLGKFGGGASGDYHYFKQYASTRYETVDLYVVCLASYKEQPATSTDAYIQSLFMESLFPECNRLSGNAHDKEEKVRLDTMAKDRAEEAKRKATEAEKREIFGK